MRKLIQLIIVLLAACIMTGCKASSTDGPSSLTIDALHTHPRTAADLYTTSSSTFADEHYLDVPETLDYLQCAETYVNSCSTANDFTVHYQAADYIKAYPVYGTHLERTDLIVYLFYSDDVPVGVASLQIDETGKAYKSSTYSDMTSPLPYVDALSNEDCFAAIVSCQNQHPDFEILGVAYSTEGYPMIYPIGHLASEEFLQFVDGSPTDFRLVQPFKSVEEGRAALASYALKRQKLLSEIAVYPWKEANWYSTGYIREFASSVMSDSNIYPYLNDYDSVIAIPLLSNDLEEGIYILHLLYQKNNLIAELVIQRTPGNNNTTYTLVWGNLAQRDRTGMYTPIYESSYVSLLDKANTYSKTWQTQGVMFDGQLKPIGLDQNLLSYYDASTDNLVSISKITKSN